MEFIAQLARQTRGQAITARAMNALGKYCAPGTHTVGLFNLVWEWGHLNVAFVVSLGIKHCPGVQINL